MSCDICRDRFPNVYYVLEKDIAVPTIKSLGTDFPYFSDYDIRSLVARKIDTLFYNMICYRNNCVFRCINCHEIINVEKDMMPKEIFYNLYNTICGSALCYPKRKRVGGGVVHHESIKDVQKFQRTLSNIAFKYKGIFLYYNDKWVCYKLEIRVFDNDNLKVPNER